MHITRYTDYSLRVLIYLAANDGKLCTIGEIAKSYDISKNHLMKIVQDLNARGYLLAVRGKNGGLCLNADTDTINIGSLVRTFEQDSKLVECFGSDNQCAITPACQLKAMFAEAMENFFRTLDAYTLQDLVGGKRKAAVQELLFINAAS